MRIGEREIGLDHPPYVIAEIGVNHDGEVSRALELTDAAADAGADAVKLQFFETDRLMSKAAKLAAYQKNAGETDPIAMLRRLELSLDEMALVVDRAHERGIHAIVTVFSTELVEQAETLAWDAYKTASPDIVNKPLLDALVQTGKPMIVSTGASTLDEVVRAVGWLEPARDRLAVLQCVSSYPAPDAALGGILAIADALGLPVGYSDHSVGMSGAFASAFGACMVEKHITYDRKAAGPDHSASLWDAQFRTYIDNLNAFVAMRARAISACRNPDAASLSSHGFRTLREDPRTKSLGEAAEILWQSRTPIEKRVLDCERDVRAVSRQSVVSAKEIQLGTEITSAHLTIKRPGTGILAYRLDEVVGQVAARDIKADIPLTEDDLAGVPA